MGQKVSAKDIERADFSVALRGYDRDEVDAFLRSVADEHRRLSEELVEAQRSVEHPYQSLGADMGELLQHAKDSADQIRRKAEDDAKQTRQEAKKNAAATREKAEREAEETRKAAEHDSTARIKEADRRVRQLMEAEAEARQRLHKVRGEVQIVMESMERAEATLGERPAEAPAEEEPARASKEGGEEAQKQAEQLETEKSPAA
jgi:cell division initiation protein